MVRDLSRGPGNCRRNLPSPPQYRKVNPADTPILVLAVRSDALSDHASFLTTRTNIISQQISQLPGVGLVTISGQRKPAVACPGRSGENSHRSGSISRTWPR